MTTTPIWFGPDDRPLLGFFHTPSSGTARAGAVICPPFGRDYLHAHYALRLLAESLTERGLCVLRFDYDGTGDSAGAEDDPARVNAWLGSISAAVETVRGAGPSSIVLVGMRIGATLAGVAAERDGDIDGLVLWDPVISGAAYLSEQRLLSALSLGTPRSREDGSVETPGLVFDATTVQDLKALDLRQTTGPLARRILVLTRADRDPGRLTERFDMPHVEWSVVTGQAGIMDMGSPYQVLPYDDIEQVGLWIDGMVPAPSAPVHSPSVAGAAVVVTGTNGTPVLETPTYLGPAGLFGILTEGLGHTTGPTILFLNVANEHRVGPSRMWVELARQWALTGIRSFRFDLSGLGDSPIRHPGQGQFVTRAPEAFDDVVDACRALRPDDASDVVLIGLCASAYQALDSAFDVSPRGVVSINPVLSFLPPELATAGAIDPRRHAAIPRKSAIQAFHGDGRLSGLRTRFPRLALRAREFFETAEALMAAPEHRPVVWLKKLTAAGVDVLIICGVREARPIKLSGTIWSFRRLERTGLYRLDLIPGLEHGLLITDQRTEVRRRVTEYVYRLAGLTAAGPQSASESQPADSPVGAAST